MGVIGVFTTIKSIEPIVEDFTVTHGLLVLSTGGMRRNSESTETEELIGADVGQARGWH
jgi:hypothetical protein